MSQVISGAAGRSKPHEAIAKRIRPSIVDASSSAEPFSLEQELKPFAAWASDTVWVPPKDASITMAQTMLAQGGFFPKRDDLWNAVVKQHRSAFTQVREIELAEASIRLPKGRLLVSVTEPEAFGRITDKIPACVQTRLDEFLAGPGKEPGVKVYYMKPLCIEVDDVLVFTSHDGLMKAIQKIQDEVFSEYRDQYAIGLPRRIASILVQTLLAIPKTIGNIYVERRKRALAAYEAKLEFQRRKTILKATKTHRKCFTTGCTFGEMMALTNPFSKADIVRQYSLEHGLSQAQRIQLLKLAAGTLPWFVAFSLAAAFVMTTTATAATPIMVCDPVFVAEMPDAPGVLLKIGHFDEIRGIMHVEI